MAEIYNNNPLNTGIVQTTNATPATIAATQCDILTNSVARVYAEIVARDAAGNAKQFSIAGLIKRAGAGASLVGAIVNLLASIGDAALATASVTIVTSGNGCIVQVTGVAATTINWAATLNVEMGYQP